MTTQTYARTSSGLVALPGANGAHKNQHRKHHGTRGLAVLLNPLTAALLGGALLVPSFAQSTDVNPFRHVAYIPAGSDLTTIRFEKVRLVNMPVRFKYTYDASYCAQVAFRESSGSMFCPHSKPESTAAAYEVIYSFVGQPTTSDQGADRHYTFSVYFRPEELSPELRKALSEGKLNRSDLAGSFEVKTSRENVRKVAIDTAQSNLCPGNYVDGTWTHTNAKCQDEIGYKWVTVPAAYITVSVDPASKVGPRPAIAAARKP